MISDDELRQIMPNCPQTKRAQYLPHLQAAMNEFGITTYLREAAFLAQLAHESGEFRWMEEIWGPTPAQRRYEPPSDLARRLGNTQPGDGKRFKGRGPIQLTGRSNYQTFGDLLHVDLVNNPQLAATPEVAFRVAALFWQRKGLNALADAQNFREITRRINGGFNGLPDREKYYNRAKSVLSQDDGATRGFAAPRGAAPAEEEAEDQNLSRGILPGDPEIESLLGPGGGKGASKKGGAKKGSAKKAAAKGGAKKAGAKKAAAGKASSKKGGAKKAAAKGGAKKAAAKGGAKKGGAKKGASKKGGAKTGSAKKGGAKKAGAKKGGAKKGR